MEKPDIPQKPEIDRDIQLFTVTLNPQGRAAPQEGLRSVSDAKPENYAPVYVGDILFQPEAERADLQLGHGENSLSLSMTEMMTLPPDYKITRYDNEIDSKKLYLESLFGYRRIQEILKGTYFDLITPQLCYKPLRQSDVLDPVLGGFSVDRRIYVKSAESIRYEISAGLARQFRNDEFRFSAVVDIPLKFLRKRNYAPVDGYRSVVPSRIPIILSGEMSRTERFAGLAYEVIQHQLEPITTAIMQRRAIENDICSEDELAKLTLIGLAEEDIIATGVIRYCLDNLWQQYGLDYNEVNGFNPNGINLQDAEFSRLQVVRAGVDRVVDFYRKIK